MFLKAPLVPPPFPCLLHKPLRVVSSNTRDFYFFKYSPPVQLLVQVVLSRPVAALTLLVLYCLKFALMHPISVYVSNNTRVLEIYDGVVDEKSRGGGRMKNVEVIVFDPRTIEVGSRMYTCMKGDGVLRVALFAGPYKVSINPNLSEGDVACHLILPILIEEDKWVLSYITTVILTPSNSWMVRVIKLLSELRDIGNGTRCG